MSTLLQTHEALVRQFGWTLLHTLWQGVVFAGALHLLLRILRDAPSDIRYIVSCGAMLSSVVAALMTFTLLAQEPTAATPSVVRPAAGPVVGTAHQAPVAAAPSFAAPPRARFSDDAADPLRYLVALYLAGVAATALWHAGGWLLLSRLRRGRVVEALDPLLARLSDALNLGRAVCIVEAVRPTSRQ
jgi:hypothetical protein